MDNRLQSKFGTKRIESRVRSLEMTIELVPVTFEREPSAIRIVSSPKQGV